LVTYDPNGNTLTANNAGTGKVVLYQKETYKYNAASMVSNVAVSKHTPTFTWNAAAPYYHNTTKNNVFSTSNSDCAFALTSSDSTIAYVANNSLYVLTKAGTATITATQEENYKWSGKTQGYSVVTSFQSNYVPFTISSSNKGNFEVSKTSNTSWDNNGYKLGEGGWTDKEANFVIGFTGVPEYVSFGKHLDNSLGQLPAGSKAILYQSADGTNWTEAWRNEERTADVNSGNVPLNSTTRYLKFYYNGSVYCHYNNIAVTEKKQFAPSVSSLDFGVNHYVNDAVASKTLSLAYANAGHKVTLSVSDDHFTVSPAEITTIGGEQTGTYTPITVSYSTAEANTPGSPKLTISDELGNSAVITLAGKTSQRTQTLAWDNKESVQTLMVKGSKQAVSATATSGLTVTYTSSDPDILAVDATGLLQAKEEGEATITASQEGNVEYMAADTVCLMFVVGPKATPVLTENGFSEGETCNLMVGDQVTLNVANVSDGLDGDFTVTPSVNGVVGITREGNSITISADHAGDVTVVAAQAENDLIFGASRTYTFHVSRYTPVFTLSDNALELAETAQLTLENVDGANISFSPEGVVSYNGSTGVITATAVGTTTLTVSQQQTNSIDAKEETFEITVSKKTPTLTVKMNNAVRTSLSVAQGSAVDIAFEHTSDAEVVVTPVSGAQYASYVNGKMTAGAVGTATYRATLAETDTCQSVSVDFTLTVTADSRHLEVNVTSETAYNNLKSGSNGDNAWKGDEGFCVGGYNGWLDGVADWNDKYVEFKFDGVPDKLTFDYKFIYRDNGLNKMTATAPGGSTVEGQLYFLYVDESADKQTWSAVWNDQVLNKDNYQSASVSLKKTTRYVRFHLHANYGALYKNIKITELKYLEDPEPASIDFGSAVINSGEVSQTSLINWCNVSPLSVTSSNPRFTVSPSQFGNFDTFGTQQLTISYTHTNEVGANEGDITISNATYTKTIHVSAETTKRSQTITWNSDLAATGYAMNVDEQYPDEIYVPVLATATNGKRITFTSDKPEIVEVVADTALLAKAVGTANITAYQAGDAEYQEVSDTKIFQVTNKQKQSILWDQNLYGLLTTSGSVELTATATSGGEITYTSGNTNVVTISGNILTVVGEGEATITATQEGFTDANEVEWLGVSQNNYVIVRNPASQCNGMALSQGSLTLNNNERVFDLSGIPATLTFTAKHGTKSALWGTAPSYAPLKVEQYANINNLWDWYEVYNKVVGTDNTSSGNIALDESAKKVRFSTIESGTDHTITDIRVTRKKFMRADVSAVDLEVESNSVWQQAITVSHSNIDLMTVTAKQGLLSFNTSTLGEGCGDFGDDAFTASFTPTIKNHEYLDTIVITDGKAQPSTILIPVRLYSKGLNQSITGFDLPTAAVATDDIDVSATASSGLEVSFESSADDIAYVADGKLVIQSAGMVTITAKQEGNETYDAAPSIAKTITISKAATSIVTAPMAADITYGQTLAEATLTGGEGSVPGTFAWEAPETQPAAGTPSYNVVFIPTQSGIYATSPSTLVSVKVAKATPSVTTWPTASDITIAQGLSDSQLTGGVASVEGTFAWKNASENRLPAGEYTRTVVFTPANENYNTVEGPVTLQVINVLAKITELPTAVVENPTFGMTLADVALQGGSANVAGAFAWADLTTPLLAGTHDYTVVFTPTDLELYSSVQGKISLMAAKATPSVTAWPSATGLVYGEALILSELQNGAADVQGTFAWMEGEAKPAAGNHTLGVRFTPTDTDNFNTVDGETTVAVAKKALTVTAENKEATYGEAAPEFTVAYEGFVNAETAEALGGELAFACEYAQGSAVGTYDITPSGLTSDNYEIEFVAGILTVGKATPNVIVWPTASAITYGKTLAEAELSSDGEADVEGEFVWQNGALVPEQGIADYVLLFVPTNANYETVEGQIEVEVNAASITTGMDAADAADKAVKVLRNNQVFIIRGGRTYTATGRLVE